MASRFQSRLIGTIVLVAIGVIILPDVLDGKKSHYKEEIASIPLKPDVDTESYQIVEPDKVDASLPASPVKAVDGARPETAHQSAEADAHPVTSAKTMSQASQSVAVQTVAVPDTNHYQDSAWMIQLMALKNDDNATNLVEDLQKRGFLAHKKRENGFTRVIIGPDVSKEKLEQQLVKLEKITGAKGQLIKFKPLNP